jgi:hypothetical protein
MRVSGTLLGLTVPKKKTMRNFYVLNNGRVKREANTLYVENADGTKKPLPVENVDSLYLYGEVDLNTRFLNFLSQKRIPLHVFNYYGFYAGSYYPREYLQQQNREPKEVCGLLKLALPDIDYSTEVGLKTQNEGVAIF